MKTYPTTKKTIKLLKKENKSIVRTASNILSSGRHLKGTLLDLGSSKSHLPSYYRFFNLGKVKKKIFLDIVFKHKPDLIADAQSLPIKSNSIDSIICFNLIEHVQNPEEAISEITRVLRKKGSAYFFTPYLTPLHSQSPKYDMDYSRLSHRSWEHLAKKYFTRFNIYPVAYGPFTQVVMILDFLLPMKMKTFLKITTLKIDEWLCKKRPYLKGKFLLGVYVVAIK